MAEAPTHPVAAEQPAPQKKGLLGKLKEAVGLEAPAEEGAASSEQASYRERESERLDVSAAPGTPARAGPVCAPSQVRLGGRERGREAAGRSAKKQSREEAARAEAAAAPAQPPSSADASAAAPASNRAPQAHPPTLPLSLLQETVDTWKKAEAETVRAEHAAAAAEEAACEADRLAAQAVAAKGVT